MRVAAYQAPLLAVGSFDALARIRVQVERCEAEGAAMLCCPEAILGGLADYSEDPTRFAATAAQLDAWLAPLASDSVTTIIGFTELAEGGRLHSSAAVFRRGSVVGLYRKLHPARNRSVYQAGCTVPVFRIEGLTFGIVICNDSNYPKPAAWVAAQGATALFVPTNNGLPLAKSHAEVVAEARNVDIARAVENGMWVVRADVAGRTEALASYGSSAIVDPDGAVVQSARLLSEDLIVAEIDGVRGCGHPSSPGGTSWGWPRHTSRGRLVVPAGRGAGLTPKVFGRECHDETLVVYGKMGSFGGRGAFAEREIEAEGDGTVRDLGHLVLEQGIALSGSCGARRRGADPATHAHHDGPAARMGRNWPQMAAAPDRARPRRRPEATRTAALGRG